MEDIDAKEEFSEVVSFLYDRLVEEDSESSEASIDSSQSKTLTPKETIEAFAEEAGLNESENFRKRYAVPCRVTEDEASVEQEIGFDYAYENGSLQRLYLRVPFPQKWDAISSRVNDASFRFEKVVQNGLIPQDGCVAFVRNGYEGRVEENVQRGVSILEQFGRVIDMDDRDKVLTEFNSL